MAKYPSINGLRALSIMLVIFHHLQLQNNVFGALLKIPAIKPFVSFLTDGYLGVNVFFVISGFLITSLMLQEEGTTRTISLKNFYIRRTLRIFPAYFFLLLVYYFLQRLGYMQISNASWLTAITYTKYLNWKLDWPTAHAWSLSIEEQFYIVWPFVFTGGKRLRKYIAIFFILIVPFIRTFTHFYPVEWINELTIFTRIDAIAVGCFFALYKSEILGLLQRQWTRIFYFSIITLFLLRYFPKVAAKIHLDSIFVPLGTTHGSIANVLIGVIMMYSVFGPRGNWYKMLNLKPVNYIGLLSYSIYLWHMMFIYDSPRWYNQFPINLICITMAALFSYYLIEKPFLRLKARFVPDRQSSREGIQLRALQRSSAT